MDLSVLETLEYNKVRAMLAGKTNSSLGRELAEGLIPVSFVHEVNSRLQETDEAVSLLNCYSNIPLGGIRDIRQIIRRAELGALLEPDDLIAIGNTLYAARRLKTFFHDLVDTMPNLSNIVSGIMSFGHIEQIIENTINEQGIIRDDASVELRRIRQEIKTAQNRVKDRLESILRSQEYQKYFQDTLVTVRGDRYVIPVKQEYRHSFPGIIHDQSASGATVFIEPMAIVNLNNDMKQLATAEKNEINRILRMIGAKISEVAPSLLANCRILAQIDFIFAKGRLALEMHAIKPIINERSFVDVKQARHPLIPTEKVVPIDIQIGKGFDILLVTGPNTGGKTVSLKTLGLFTLMFQAGLFIPAAVGSEMTVFNNIYADIGDEQSIEHSLSTFSAHMTNLVRILDKVSHNDLILIDEIGAGTDPDEGAALAMAILDFLLNVGAKAVATTHYSELKTFAYSRHGIENASVEFDIQTLKPTYRLLTGIPGSSNAFAISKRLGLADEIIARARELIDQEHADLESVLVNLEEQRRVYKKLQVQIQNEKQQFEVIKAQLYRENQSILQKKEEILARARNEAAVILRNAKRETEQIIKEIKNQFTVQDGRQRQKTIQLGRMKLRELSHGVATTSSEADITLPPIDKYDLKPGMNVYVTSLQQKGTILSIGHDDVTVQMGIMKMSVPFSACRQLNEPQKANDVVRRVSLAVPRGGKEVHRQTDIRGMTVEEAEIVLEKFIDDALLAGLSQVIVIHGKGTGALRKGIRTYLKEHRYVKEISIGELNEGGDGVTVVRLI